MKTLQLKNLSEDLSWLETDSGFAVLFQGERAAVAEMRVLAPGKTLYFSTPGTRELDPRIRFSVRRLAWPSSRIPAAQITEAVLALAVFVAGVFMVAR